MSSRATIGADPEMFVMDRATASIIPICGRIGGTKLAPKRMRPDWPETYSLQEDNVMLEFNVPPSTSVLEFQSSMKHATDHIAGLLQSKGLVAYTNLTECLFDTATLAKFPQAMEFGCSPDFSAYDHGAPNKMVDKKALVQKDKEWRFCGGHVHVGYEAKIPPFAVAGLLDIALGLPSIGEDNQKERRKYYGTAGRYRPTKYGIEYRVLSNYWIWSNSMTDRIARRVFTLTAHLQGSTGILQSYYTKMPWADIRTAIDTNNVDLARQLTSFIKDEVGFKLDNL